jgi:hypothetical protein
MAFAFEVRKKKHEYTAELEARGITSLPAGTLALVNAFYYNESTNNIRHESLCCAEKQPTNGWRVSTVPDMLHCECNVFDKRKFCCHLLYALDVLKKNFKGVPLPPATFARTLAKKSAAAPRFDDTGSRNVRQRATVGRALELQ